MIYLESRDTRSDFNLALEQYVFENMPVNESYFMLWQNSPAVIVGKYQNTLEEINAAYVREHNIRVTRRLSGGGAVYHDLGNINYTYIVDGTLEGNISMEMFCNPLIKTLGELGIKAELTGRNDVTINGQKISGNAQYSRKGRIMHHGTILYDSDLSVLQKVLNVSKDKIQSKGIKSVRSRVTNIREHMTDPVSLEKFWNILRQHMCEGNVEHYRWSQKDMEKVEEIRKNRYALWEWTWGNSPACSIRKERRVEGCGTLQVYLDINRGRIDNCHFCGDFFGEGPSEELYRALKGCALEYSEMKRALADVDINQCFYHLPKEKLVEILIE